MLKTVFSLVNSFQYQKNTTQILTNKSGGQIGTQSAEELSSDTRKAEPEKNPHEQKMLGKKTIYIYLSLDRRIHSKADFPNFCSSVKRRKFNFMDETVGDVNKEIRAAFSR